MVGASTHAFGNQLTAVLGAVGRVAYALAGAIGRWAVGTGVVLLRRSAAIAAA